MVAPLGGLPSRVTQVRKSLGVFVCLPGFSRIFTEWHLRRLQTQIPFGLLKQGPKRGPAVRAISRVMNQIEGPDFFRHFFTKINVHKIYARSDGRISPPTKGGDLPRGSYLVYGLQGTFWALPRHNFRKTLTWSLSSARLCK